MNLPNAISTFRLFLVPIFAFVYFSSNEYSNFYAFLIFFTAGVSDILDGYIARKYNLVTKLGRIIDPLADKLMVFTALVCLSISGYIPYIFPIFFFLKEGYQVYGAIRLAGKISDVPAANVWGKSATCLFYLGITVSTLFRQSGQKISIFVLTISIIVSVIAFISYYKRGKNLIAHETFTPEAKHGGN